MKNPSPERRWRCPFAWCEAEHRVPRADAPALRSNAPVEHVAQVGRWNCGGVPVAVGARSVAVLDAHAVTQKRVHALFIEPHTIIEHGEHIDLVGCERALDACDNEFCLSRERPASHVGLGLDGLGERFLEIGDPWDRLSPGAC